MELAKLSNGSKSILILFVDEMDGHLAAIVLFLAGDNQITANEEVSVSCRRQNPDFLRLIV